MHFYWIIFCFILHCNISLAGSGNAFTPELDKLLIESFQELYEDNNCNIRISWIKVANLYNEKASTKDVKTPKQLRERYLNHLQSCINKTSLSVEERSRFWAIIESSETPYRWEQIAKKHFNGRTGLSLRNLYYAEMARKAKQQFRQRKRSTAVMDFVQPDLKKEQLEVPAFEMPVSEEKQGEAPQAGNVSDAFPAMGDDGSVASVLDTVFDVGDPFALLREHSSPSLFVDDAQ